MKRDCKRYDAWGNPILPLFAMKSFYRGNDRATSILERLMAHQYVVVPNVEIRINLQDTSSIYVWLIYPGGSRMIVHNASKKRLEGLRALFKGKKGWTHYTDKNSFVVFRREGCVIPDPARKFYSHA